MKLTGKCKADFEKWFKDNHNAHYLGEDLIYQRKFDMMPFDYLEDSMQYGVYVDFFDSVGVFIDIKRMVFTSLEIKLFNWNVNQFGGFKDTRPEARTAAIEKANEIYNQKP